MTQFSEIPLPVELEGKSVEIGFRYSSDINASQGRWVLDNIVVKSGKDLKPFTMFEENFNMDMGGFEVEGYNGSNADNPIWYRTSSYVKADAYNKIKEPLENYLVSPEFKLAKTNNTIELVYSFIDYSGGKMSDQVGISIREKGGVWVPVSIESLEPSGKFIERKGLVIPDEFGEKTVQLGFKYTAKTSDTAPIFSINHVLVIGYGGEAPKQDPGIYFPYDELEATLGKDFISPALMNPNAVEVVYSSDKPEVAVVDADTGDVTLVGEGTATITATSIETEVYSSSSVSYLLIVKEPLCKGPVIFSESFASDMGAFSIEGNNGENNNIWSFMADGMNADAFGKIGNEQIVAYLVSPEITLATENTLMYYYKADYFKYAAMAEEMAFVVREVGGEWEKLEIPNLTLSSQFVESGLIKIPATYDNKKVQVAFRYSASSGGDSGSWTVNNLEIHSAGISEKADPQISFDVTEINYNMGEEFNAPVLNNPNNVTVSYTSSDAAIAEVDSVTGIVTFHNEGVVTITATSTETDEYKSGNASYTVTVTVPTGIEGITADDLKNGNVYDIQGRRVYKIGKGIYILKGKKIVIR